MKPRGLGPEPVPLTATITCSGSCHCSHKGHIQVHGTAFKFMSVVTDHPFSLPAHCLAGMALPTASALPTGHSGKEPAAALCTLTGTRSGSPCHFPGCRRAGSHDGRKLSSSQQGEAAPRRLGPLWSGIEAQHLPGGLRDGLVMGPRGCQDRIPLGKWGREKSVLSPQPL